VTDEITKKIESTEPFLLSEYRVEVNSDTKEIKLIHKETKAEKFLSVNSDTPEGVYHISINCEDDLHIVAQLIISGYFLTQDKKAINPNVSNNETFLIEGFRLRHPELNFETNMFDATKSIIRKVAIEVQKPEYGDAENILLDFFSYVGMCYSKNKRMEIQVSKKTITSIQNIEQIPLLLINFFLFSIKDFGLSYKEEKETKAYLTKALVEFTEGELRNEE